MIIYVNGLLAAWGRWAKRGEDGGVGWPTCSPMFRDAPSGVSVHGSKPPLGVGQGAAECEQTDLAVRMLQGQDGRLYDLCVAMYKNGGGRKAKTIAADLGIGTRTMYDRLDLLHRRVQDNLQEIAISA